MKKIICIVTLVFVIFLSFAQDANKRTALRYLQLSKDSLVQASWNDAYNLADIGLSYDSTIADLWYVQALAAKALSKKPFEVIPLVLSSLSGINWYDYNSNAARLLLASLYIEVGEFNKALDVVEQKPILITAEALRIKAQAYYGLGELEKARDILLTASKTYPSDIKFPMVFFTNELHNVIETQNATYTSLKDIFLKEIFNFGAENPEILLLGSFYAEDSQKQRLVKVYKTTGISSIYYPFAALDSGLITQTQAFNLFVQISDNNIRFSLFSWLLSYITDESLRKEIDTFLDGYNGVMTFDSNNDGIEDLFTKYENGRPKDIKYDSLNNGSLTWQMFCDYGTPRKLLMSNSGMTVTYARYPFVSSVYLPSIDTQFNLVPDSIQWSPVAIVAADFSSSQLAFYIPRINNDVVELSEQQLVMSSASLVTSTNERHNGTIRFVISNMQPINAVYLSNNTPYAYASFENGILQFRNVDNNNDGLYELTELYDYDESISTKLMTENEEKALNLKIYGNIATVNGLYLSGIVFDENGDTIPEYMAQYNSDGSTTMKWDYVGNSNWNTWSTVDKEGSRVSNGFINPVSNETVEVYFQDDIPVTLIVDNVERAIVYEENEDFYWIGEVPDNEKIANFVKENINFSGSSDVYSSVINIPNELVESNIETTNIRILAFKIGNMYFGEIVNDN